MTDTDYADLGLDAVAMVPTTTEDVALVGMFVTGSMTIVGALLTLWRTLPEYDPANPFGGPAPHPPSSGRDRSLDDAVGFYGPANEPPTYHPSSPREDWLGRDIEPATYSGPGRSSDVGGRDRSLDDAVDFYGAGSSSSTYPESVPSLDVTERDPRMATRMQWVDRDTEAYWPGTRFR